MDKRLEEIILKIESALDIIVEYGEYVDAYVNQNNPVGLLQKFGSLSKGIQKAMFYKENEDMIMKILDSAIKKFTQADILMEIAEPLKEFGVDMSDYIDNIYPEDVKAIMNHLMNSIDKDVVKQKLIELNSLKVRK
nr:MAG: hypothetical protein [Bacteriophage sp.]